MIIKKFIRTGMVSTIAILASNNVAFAESCSIGLEGYCLTDGNANFSFIHHDVGGSNSDDFRMEMSVDGITQVWNLDFMIDRTSILSTNNTSGAHVGTESYIGDPTAGFTYTGTNQVDITGRDIGYGTIDLGFTLDYQSLDAATLTQTFTFTNTSGSTITDLSFLALTDVNLGGYGEGFYDQGQLIDAQGNPITSGSANPTGYRQWSNNGGLQDFELLASVDVPVDHYEVSVSDSPRPCETQDLCYRAVNNDDVALTDTVYEGEQDLVMAANWLRSVADGESFSYTQTFQIFDPTNPPPSVPVPAAVWLFGSGLIGLVGVARRKQSLKA